MNKSKRSMEKLSSRGVPREMKSVLQAANSYIVQHFPIGCLGRDPRRLVGETDVWIVPIVLTSPGHGPVGEVGMIAVDAISHRIVSATERREVNRAVKQLKESKRNELEAALHRARTV
jgi:hypothetical protein